MPSTLALRLRSDLVVTREAFGTRTYAVVKDPIALRYFRFQEEEFAVLELLDGKRTLDEMQTALEAKFAPQKFPPEGLSQFISTLHATGLVISDVRGQGVELLAKRSKARRKEILHKFLSPMSIRLRGIDPTRLFDCLLPLFRWCFTKSALIALACFGLAALALITMRYDDFLRKTPTFQQFFTPANMFLLLGLLGTIKVLHEFGHGLACRRFGGECHDLGLMFLVFAPCLYCNVSDAWRLPKRQRIAISSAGMVVELAIMATAVFGWWATGPGLLNQLCLGALFVSGFSTLVINGNPLMRYDGYFILSDLVETPNLAEKSSAVLRGFLTRHLWGIAEEPDPLVPRTWRAWFMLYAVLSVGYRIALSYSIFAFLMEWLEPYRLQIVARLFGLLAVGSMTAMPLWRCYKFFSAAGRRRQMGRARVVASLCGAAALVAGFLHLPLPQRVWGTLEIEPRDVARLYVDVPGRIVAAPQPPGTKIAAGTVVAQLENLDLELKIAEFAGRAEQYRTQLNALRRERFHDATAALRIPELSASLAAIEELLAERKAERTRLTITAPRDGVVLPPPETPTRNHAQATELSELPTWAGLPTDQRNRGAMLEAGTFFCQIGDEHEWEAIIAVDQDDIALLNEGQIVDIRFDHHADFTVTAKVTEISRRELTESSRRLSNKSGGELATTTDETGVERPLNPTYQVRVVLYDPTGQLRIGLRGTARIHVPAASLGTRSLRWLRRTFHFEW